MEFRTKDEEVEGTLFYFHIYLRPQRWVNLNLPGQETV